MAQEPQSHCCILWTDENYSGDFFEFCRKKNFMQQFVATSAYSFVDSDDTHFMNANMESFKCGSEVRIDFCYGAYNRKQRTNENGKFEQYNECEVIAFQASANDQVASGID